MSINLAAKAIDLVWDLGRSDQSMRFEDVFKAWLTDMQVRRVKLAEMTSPGPSL